MLPVVAQRRRTSDQRSPFEIRQLTGSLIHETITTTLSLPLCPALFYCFVIFYTVLFIANAGRQFGTEIVPNKNVLRFSKD